jgi:hypothetical protein
MPALSAWLLHAIRSQLSRPSEGLVSNYNLTIFLLVAEVRPMSHLLKLIQQRTVFLQRKVSLEHMQDLTHPVGMKLDDLSMRLEEMEAAVANGIAAKKPQAGDTVEDASAKATTHAVAEIKRTLQPELDALGRAMRRYEKKSTISAVQIEARLQDLESRLGDVVVLAAAAQRSAQGQPKKYYLTMLNWISACVVVPIEIAQSVLSLPGRIVSQVLGVGRSKRSKDGKAPRRQGKPQPRLDRDKRLKA